MYLSCSSCAVKSKYQCDSLSLTGAIVLLVIFFYVKLKLAEFFVLCKRCSLHKNGAVLINGTSFDMKCHLSEH